MLPLQIAENIYDVGVQDWAVRDFHGYKTERGATYNSYLIMDEKVTLIDTVKAPFTEELLANITSAVREIIAHERRARKALTLYTKDRLEDEVWRAYGTLKYARFLADTEVLSLLSKVRLGIDLGILDGVRPEIFTELLVAGRSNYLQQQAGNENMSKNEIDRKRAEIVRQVLDSPDPQQLEALAQRWRGAAVVGARTEHQDRAGRRSAEVRTLPSGLGDLQEEQQQTGQIAGNQPRAPQHQRHQNDPKRARLNNAQPRRRQNRQPQRRERGDPPPHDGGRDLARHRRRRRHRHRRHRHRRHDHRRRRSAQGA